MGSLWTPPCHLFIHKVSTMHFLSVACCQKRVLMCCHRTIEWAHPPNSKERIVRNSCKVDLPAVHSHGGFDLILALTHFLEPSHRASIITMKSQACSHKSL